MSPDNILLTLFKANMLLQMNITRLAQKSGQGWLDAARQSSGASLTETSRQIDNLLQAADWPALMALPNEMLQRHSDQQQGGQQALTQIAIQQQILFANGLQQALVAWQKSVVEAFGDRPGAASFVEIMRQWGRPWTGNADHEQQ